MRPVKAKLDIAPPPEPYVPPAREITTILQDAQRATRERAENYGPPEINFERIANLWSAYLQKQIGKRDVAMLMILVKVARDQHMAMRDNCVDIAGYADCADRV